MRVAVVLTLVVLVAAGAPVAAAAPAELLSRQGQAAGMRASNDPSLTADGRFAAFTTEATNLGATERSSQYSHTDIVLHDRRTGATRLISPAGGPSDGFSSSHPQLSADGRYLAFLTDGAFVADDGDPGAGSAGSADSTDVYVRDLRRGTVELASRAAGARGANGEGYAFEPSISADGRFVAFTSPDRSLAPSRGGMTSAFVRDRRRQRLTVLPSGPRGRDPLLGFSRLSLAPDGRTAAYTVAYGRPDSGPREIRVVRHDLRRGRTTLVDRYFVGPSTLFRFVTGTALSSDGRLLAYADLGGTRRRPTSDTNRARVMLLDVRTGRRRVVVRRATAPTLSPDGSALAYTPLTREQPAIAVRRLRGGRTRFRVGYAPAFTRDGGRFAFASDPPDGTLQVVLERLRR